MKFHTPRESFRWLKALWDHRRVSRMSRERLEQEQLEKFRALVAHASAHSPYYRAIIQRRKIDLRSCVPTDFPVLTKQDVIKHFDDIVTDRAITTERIAEFLARSTDPAELFQGRYHVLHTSGSSGTMGCFVFSHDAWVKGVSRVLAASPLRLRLRRRVAFVGATRGHFAGVSMMLAGNDGSNALFYNVRTIDVGQPTARIIDQLNAFQPQVLSAYARVLQILAEAQVRGELRLNLEEAGSGGEPLLPEVRSFVEKAFQAPVKNGYASSEHLYMALPLPGSDGLNLLEGDLIFELGPDYTCVTNLCNPAMPLIRYRMEDVLMPQADGSSPYPFTRIKDIVGRQEDALAFVNERGINDSIHPLILTEIVVTGLHAWQIVLESKTSFRFRAQFDPKLSAPQHEEARQTLVRKLRTILEEKEMGNVLFEIEEVASLPVDTRTGKFRLVAREPSYSMVA